jgi:hypothetical protein
MNNIERNTTSQTLEYGEVISFGTHGTISRFETKGLDLNDGDHHSWTMTSLAEIHFGLRLPQEKVELRFEAAPFLQASITSQQLFIYLNGLFVSFLDIKERETFSILVDRAMISSRQNRLCFVVPTAISPQVLGISDDRRQLGIVFTSLSFRITQ